MRNLITRLALSFLLLAGTVVQRVYAQSVLNPSDPVITYNPNTPPTQPPWGQIGKWVRTVRMDWNTDMYKAYIYKGMAFRLHFPKTYNPTAVDGKKYPVMVFFHGHGEYGPITDNEFHLLHGHQGFDNAITYGAYDGYILSPQSTDFFTADDYTKVVEIIEYMVTNNKVDPFHITVNGLSQGGQACWEILHNYPNYISGSTPMSWASTLYTDSEFVNKVKYTPLWEFQGGLDDNPTPYIAYQVRDAMQAAGAQYKLTVYPDVGHGTWYSAWAENDFWPFNNRAYSSNPWQVGGKTDYWPGTAINATLGLAPGFSAYQWRKDGAVITTAATNTLNVTATGVYDARVQRNGVWSDWSHIPVTIKYKTFVALPAKIEAENWAAMGGTQKEMGVQTEWTADASNVDVGWIDQGDWMDYNVNSPSAASYTVNLRIATPNTGAQLQFKKQDGTVLATVNLPSTGGWQNWQTISTNVTLPAGNQIIRIESTAVPGWNFNWFEFTNGTATTNQPPVANAGTDKTVTLPTNSVTLTGSGSDPDGTIASYAWTLVSGPAGSSFTAPSSATTTVNGLVKGTYTFRLTVTDNKGASASDDVVVTVNDSTTPPPPSTSIHIEAENWASMSGVQTETAYDAGGGLDVGWIDLGDWMNYSINPASSGTYTFKFRIATPNNGAQFQVKNAAGTVLATVNLPNTGAYQTWQTTSVNISLTAGAQTIRLQSSAQPGWNINWFDIVSGGGNAAPVANAGADQTITLPTSSVTLSGSGSDADGSIASYAWTKISGPTGGTFGSPSSASTTVSGLTQGTYTFRLTVTDNLGATGTDDVVVTVNGSTPPSTSIHIEAENWTAMSGVQTETVYDAGGGKDVGWIDLGDWMEYSINPSVSGTYTVRLRIATPNNGAQVQIKNSKGTVLATVNLPNTGAYQTWQTVTTNVSLSAGQQTIRLQSSATPGWNINWLEIVQGANAGFMVQSVARPDQPQASASVDLFPNPVQDRFTLTIDNSLSGNARVQIVNMNGVVQKEFAISKAQGPSQHSLSIGTLPKGRYMISVQMGGWRSTSSLIKL